VLEIILDNTLFIAKDKESIAILDNSSIHKDTKSMEAKQYSMQLEVGAQSEPFDKSRSMHTQYVGLTNVYYIQNNRDIHKVTLNPFTPKPLFQSQTLLSTK
jgi:hypothetical protein